MLKRNFRFRCQLEAPQPQPPEPRCLKEGEREATKAGPQYTSPEEIDAQLQAEKQKAREEEEQGEEGGDGAAGDPKKERKP